MTFGIIFLIVIILLMITAQYLLIRNTFVYKYRIDVIDRCYAICEQYLKDIDSTLSTEEYQKRINEHNIYYRKTWNDIMETLDYDKLLYSFKPLKDKYWLNEEQLKFINLYKAK